jgi:Flp pilus assembly protein TadB
MTTAISPRLLLAAIAVVAAVGVFDAVTGNLWDLVVLLSLILVLAVVGLLWSLGQRRPMTLRADLASSLTSRAQSSGEPLDQALDRAVATYMTALNPQTLNDEDRTPTSGER